MKIEGDHAEADEGEGEEEIEKTAAFDVTFYGGGVGAVLGEDFVRGGGDRRPGRVCAKRSKVSGDGRGRRGWSVGFDLNFLIDPRELLLQECALMLELLEAVGHGAKCSGF